MAQYCTCQTDHGTVYALLKLRVQHALHFDSVEILDVYSLAIWGARNLKVKSYMRSAISHVRPSPMAGTNLISMGWAHEPVPF